jgi:two-component system CheB/CheR fusion protein
MRLLRRVRYDHASFVVLMHLSPTWNSKLSDVLQRHSLLQVHKVTEPTELWANHVYVAGEGVDLLVEDGLLCTSPRRRSVPPRTIDRLMAALAKNWGTHAIGIVLSGAGDDGTAGLLAIRQAGGTTMVQSPESAEADSMPSSARRFADYCLPPEELGDQLMRVLGAPPLPATSAAS